MSLRGLVLHLAVSPLRKPGFLAPSSSDMVASFRCVSASGFFFTLQTLMTCTQMEIMRSEVQTGLSSSVSSPTCTVTLEKLVKPWGLLE